MQRLKVGDLVQVIAGRDKGKRGKVTRILHKQQRVLVEGLNKVTRHQKPNQRDQQGGRLEREAPIHVSNVMLVDADSDRPTRVKAVRDDDGGKRRAAVSGAELKTG
ncbi:MAG: 50S ribosomal protein L24 [Deltaproteobacteria bacterium]|jgi:large subunit ribosomal protein L24|nr:50S ribosomal protein L24 [Deltaproteobacteria bacterium]MBW2529926.1 50S ribosomal protein L24 [Deltaproteobacteria bacterium]